MHIMPKLINAVICTSIFTCCLTDNAFDGVEKEGEREKGEGKGGGKNGMGDTPGC